MKKLNRNGFTLIELLATIILLAIIMGIGSYSITAILVGTREKDYEKMVEEIVNAVEIYYQECKFVNNNCDDDSKISLGFLVTNGYLKGNDGDDLSKLVSPNPTDKNNKEITNCEIKYEYRNGKISVEAVNPSGSCPVTCDYNPQAGGC